jgi:hypothetical protein
VGDGARARCVWGIGGRLRDSGLGWWAGNNRRGTEVREVGRRGSFTADFTESTDGLKEEKQIGPGGEGSQKRAKESKG